MDTDVVVIGGGAAGLAAVREARRRGAKATMITSEPPGGDCTFTGCVPSKTLISSAAAGVSFDETFERIHAVVAEIAATESIDVLRKEGTEVIEGFGTLVGPGAVEVDGRTLQARGVVLAMGSKPALPPIPGLNRSRPREAGSSTDAVLTSDTLWGLGEAPESLAIIGGGAIGCELGLALAGLGVAVTLIEGASRVLPNEEPAASQIIERSLAEAGVRVLTSQFVSKIQAGSPGENHSEVTLSPAPGGDGADQSNGSNIVVVAARILVATGRQAVTTGSGDVELDKRGFVVVEDTLATSMDRVFAAGDLNGLAPFTHAADAMGRLATSNILRRFGAGSFRTDLVPRVTYTSPEVASIGLSESEAATLKGATVAELPMSEHDRARTSGVTEGYIKLIAAPRRLGGKLGGGRIVGATIVAPRAGEMLAEISLMMRTDAMVGRLAQTMHPYPSWSYGLAKAAGQFFTEVEGRTARPASSMV